MTDSISSQDRRTRMLISSVNAPAKKGGAGGSYTWGSPLDVKDYEPVGLQGGYGVVTSPVVATTSVGSASPTFQMDTRAFPTLGTAPIKVATQSWGPTSMATVNLTESSLRPGALEVIDSTHPRNMFAKKPYVRPATTTVTAAPAQEALIDWSKTGMPEAVMKAIVTSNAGAAHLGPYNQAAPSQVPLEVLRTQNVATQAQFQQYAPKVSKHAPQLRSLGVIQQPQKR